jgi:hypothetical protein
MPPLAAFTQAKFATKTHAATATTIVLAALFLGRRDTN